MERIDGPTMVDTMSRPWRLAPCLHTLADLHDQLHEIVAPDWLDGLSDAGDRVLHLDLHPMNVIMSARGPVVIDWPNARRGEPTFDVAVTYAMIVCGRIPLARPIAALIDTIRRPVVDRAFARRYRGRRVRSRRGRDGRAQVLRHEHAARRAAQPCGRSQNGRGHRGDGSPRLRHPVPLASEPTARRAAR